ncbi:hypothetical protein ZWY2020_036136 [Hordeum vulgare]|nr:hypothetical protein ZWY2020_036136 [Hordeum vulgare]
MNRVTGERIGADVHELVQVDVGPDGTTVGRYLRVKVKMNITVPLMRGFVLDRDTKEEKNTGADVAGEEDSDQNRKKGLLWCRFEYEHMRDFCYTCDVIRHGERDCITKPKKGEVPQFGPWLQAEVYHRRTDVGVHGRGQGSRSLSGSEGSQERKRTFGWGKGSRGSGSNAASWKRDDVTTTSNDKDMRQEENEVTSPLKLDATRGEDPAANKVSKRLQFQNSPTEQPRPGCTDMDVNHDTVIEEGEEKTQGDQVRGDGGGMGTGQVQGGGMLAEGGEAAEPQTKGGNGKRFKRRGQGREGKSGAVRGELGEARGKIWR